MCFDLRVPMGLLFGLFGLILAVYGLATSGDAEYAKSLGINANLIWGTVMFIFGGVMLGLAVFVRARKGGQ